MASRQISHYEILETIGEGGMGVVSLARDTRLGRQVALKVLREKASYTDEQKQRFIQEARTASALNHPNIITIYDIETVDGVDLIAMEYVRGKQLDEVVGRRGLPVGQVLRYSVQISHALEAAHDANIIHRDIKPANIMISDTGVVKVLDFGLAKLHKAPERVDSDAGPDSTQARMLHRTADGMILGTLAYMSPEQATGKTVDARSDIFSFGVVLFEMLTGRRPFRGDSSAELVSSILRDDPPSVREIARDVPRELERIVNRCLRKDPERRFQDMADLRVALEELKDEHDSGKLGHSSSLPSAPERASSSGWKLAAFALLLLMGLGAFWIKVLKPTPQQVTNLSRLTSDPGLTSFPAISNDGSLVAYASDRAGSGNLDIWVQQFSGGQTIRVTSEETDEYEPVFSPDGAMIAFRSERDGGGIYVIPALGGSQRLVVRHGRSPAFSPDGQQIAYAVGSAGVGATFSFGASSIFVVPVNGGEPKRIAANFAVAHHPVWSEDGTHILFEGNRVLGPPDFEICAASAATGEVVTCTDIFKQLRTQKLSIGPYPIAVNGQTIFFSVGVGDSVNLWRARLTRDWKLQGPPEQLTFGTGLERQPSVSRNNRMVFTSGLQNTDVWELPVDANTGAVTGDPRQLTRDAAEDYYPEIAANGSRIAFISSRGGNDDVWILDPSGKPTSLMATPARELYPKLTADGNTVVFSSIENGRRGVFLMPATGGVPKKLCDDCGLPRDVSADASKVLLQTGPPPSVSLLDVATGKIEPLLVHKEQPIYAPKLSPDENWVAFQVVQRPTSRVIYAAPFRPSGKTDPSEWVQITDGSVMDRNPAWSPDGSLLYFLSERDSFRCIWAQRVDRASKKPVGRPFAVAHFHNSVRSLMNIDGPGQVSLSVAKDRLVFAMGEIVANIWLAQLGPGR